MKSTIFYETPDQQGVEILNYLKDMANKKATNSEFIDLSSAQMTPCGGCFSCWHKTPGLCIHKDDGLLFTQKEINSDSVVYLFPVTWGGFSPKMKIYQDRSLGRVLPFFVTRDGETHHPKRYGQIPKAYIIGYGKDLTNQERTLFSKNSQNVADNITDGATNSILITNSEEYKQLDSFFIGGTDE